MLTVSQRVKFFLTGALFPLCCVAAVWIEPFSFAHEPWQSGHIQDYAILMLRWPTIGAFVPVIVASAASLTIWTALPGASRYAAVRWGIVTGIPVTLLYLLLILVTTGPITFIAAAFFGPALAVSVYGIKTLYVRARRFTILHLLIFTTFCALGVFVANILGIFEYFIEAFLSLCLWIAAATPTLNLITYIRAAITVRDEENAAGALGTRRKWLVGLLAFFVAHGASARLSLALLLEEYAKLPMTDPNCYLSSAAAHGHAWLVGEACGEVSRQTKRLKFLELVICLRWPHAHRVVRKIYNRCGPTLARVCRMNRWFADATYLVLTPLERVAEWLRSALEVPSESVAAMYRG